MRPTLIALAAAVLLATAVRAPADPAQGTAPAAAPLTPHQRLAREIYKELIEIDTTHATGSTTRAAEAMARRLGAAGFPKADVLVLEPHPKKGNLVARLRGSGKRRPILLLAHLDVVDARREDWSVEPFVLTEQDGFFYGRGTLDDKAMAAIFVANLIRMKQEGFVPDRDVIVALTADEDGGDHNGAKWLVDERRDLVDAAFVINEGGRGASRDGKYLFNGVQASEKVYVSFRLEVKNRGGHSSVPRPDNAIVQLAAGLVRLSRHQFPAQLSDITRAFFERAAGFELDPKVAADMRAITKKKPDAKALARLSKLPTYNALLRTTCVPTRLEAGHADNALPQTARALVNCRMLPGSRAEDVERELVRVLSDPEIAVTMMDAPTEAPASPLDPEVFGAVERVTSELWPGVPVVPMMGTGATDSKYFRLAGIPAYGVSGLFTDIDDVRMHGRDERLGVRQFYEGQEFLYRLVLALSSGS